jgi:hypothetical protein
VLNELKTLTTAVEADAFSKYQHLLELLRELGADALQHAPRIIVFSERIATLGFLLDNLKRDLRVTDEAIVEFHAGLPDVTQTAIVDS